MRYPHVQRFLAVTICLAVSAGALGAPSAPRAASAGIAPPAPRRGMGGMRAPSAALRAGVARSYTNLPLAFEPNQGQAGAGIDFVARGAGYAVSLGATGMTIGLAARVTTTMPATMPATAVAWQHTGTAVHEQHVLAQNVRFNGKPSSDHGRHWFAMRPQSQASSTLRLTLTGADQRARAVGLDRLPGVANYILGRDPRRWRTGVPTYARVAYRAVYPGVDLVYYGTGQRLEYDVVLAPGADSRRLALAVDGARGIAVDRAGSLVLRTTGGEVRQDRPDAYQDVGGARRAVVARYVLRGHEVGVAVGRYDHARPLVIDPVLSYATYLGGNSTDTAAGVAVDASGSAYVVGTTNSTNYPTTTGAAQTANSAADNVFVTKMNPAGNGLVYSTYLGGNGGDVGMGIAVDGAGRAYVTGHTNSTDFPIKNAFQGTKSAAAGGNGNGNNDAFVARLNAAGGALDYSSYLGGSIDDEAQGIAVDGAGGAYVAGFTYSSDFPTTSGAFGTVYNNGGDAFVARINTNASGTASLTYGTYLGGGGADVANAIAVDAAGNAYVTGSTGSADFPTMGAAQGTLASASGNNAFVSKLNATGSALVYSAYLGGSGSDAGNGIAVDATGAAYVTGSTSSPNFPTTGGAFRTTFAGGPGNGDAFVVKLNPAGNGLAYGTYLGGGDEDEGLGIALDSAGDAYVTGRTPSSDFPTQNALSGQGTFGGGTCGDGPCADAFVAAFNPAGSALLYSTYLGGNDEDEGAGIALDPAGAAYVSGVTASSNFPASNAAPQKTNAGTSNAFIVKIAAVVTPASTPTAPPVPPGATSTPTAPGGPNPGATPTGTRIPGAPSATASVSGAPSPTPPSLPMATATTGGAPGGATATGIPAGGATSAATAIATPTGTPANSATAIARATGASIAMATAGAQATVGAAATQAVVGPSSTPSGTGSTPGQPTPAPGQTGGNARPGISLDPTSAHAGGRVVVTGGGFKPGELVTLSLNGEALATGAIVVGSDGRFTAAFVAPGGLLQGANTVAAFGTGGDTAMATLTGLVGVAAQYYIAGGVNAASEQSSLAVLNTTGARAAVRVVFYYTNGATDTRFLHVGAHAQQVVSMHSLRLRSGDVGLSLTADRRVTAQLDIARPGRDGDSILGNTGLGQTWYLAEGYTGLTFRETVAVLNPGARAARVSLQLLPFGGRRGRVAVVTVRAHSEGVYDVGRLLPRASLSIVARSNQPIVVARTLRFSRVGGSAQRGSGRDYGVTTRAGGNVAATSWLLAEGMTANHFQTFLTILNPGDRRAGVTATFYGSTGRMLGKRSMVMAPRSRANVKLNDVANASGIASMVASSQPVIVERPEYFGSPNAARVAGSDVFGRNGAAPRWTFPGGDASRQSEFYLLYNPSATTARVRVTLYGGTGRTATQVVYVGPRVRYTLDAGRLFRGFPGAHGAMLESLNGVGFVAERTVFASDRSTLQSTQGLAQ